MAVTTPPTISALPTPPSTSDPATFDTRADAFMAALPTHTTETNAASANVYANAVDAAASATAANADKISAAGSAAAAAASAGAATWANTGATYVIGDLRKSPSNGRIYRRLTASNAGTTDPSVDTTNWAIYTLDPIWAIKTGNYTAVAGDALLIDTTSAAITITLPASPSANHVVRFADYAGTWGTNKVTFGRNGSKVMGLSEDYDITTANLNGVMTYIDSIQGWKHL